MNKIQPKEYKNFEDIKKVREDGSEYWCARDLQLVLNYKEWRKFENVINKANEAHYTVGKNIREVIAKNGGTMPEELPTPEKSLKQLEKENKNTLIE